jgi:hypothetical protein
MFPEPILVERMFSGEELYSIPNGKQSEVLCRHIDFFVRQMAHWCDTPPQFLAARRLLRWHTDAPWFLALFKIFHFPTFLSTIFSPRRSVIKVKCQSLIPTL